MCISGSRFHTIDFDQEMLDFIKQNFITDEVCNLRDDFLNYDPSLGYFWTANSTYTGWLTLTKQQFKEKIGMPQDNIVEESTFGKKDLVDGMFVKTRDCGTYLKLGELLLQGEGFLYLDDYDENLIDIRDADKGFDIIEVLTPNKPTNLNTYLGGYNSDSIWKRTPPKSEKVIKLEQLIAMQEEQLEATKKLLAEELNNV